MTGKLSKWTLAVPVVVGLAAVAALVVWFNLSGEDGIKLRLPGTDLPPGVAGAGANPVLSGKLVHGDGLPADLPGAWPQFRGPTATASAPESIPLARTWHAVRPAPIWTVDVGEGYAGATVLRGRVYVMDYDREASRTLLRCLSLAPTARRFGAIVTRFP